MIKGLEIRNFRGIRKAVLDELKQVTILIGKNGAGKSTILEAIYTTSAWADYRDTIRNVSKLDYIIQRRGKRGNWKTFRDALWYSMDVYSEISIKLTMIDGKELEFTLIHEEPEPKVWLKTPKQLSSKIADFTPTANYSLLSIAFGQLKDPTTNYIKNLFGNLLTGFEKHYDNEIKFLKNVLLIDQHLLSLPSKIEEATWPKILAKRHDKLLIEMLREEFEVDAEGLTYMPMGGVYGLAVQLPKTTVRIDDLGDGARNALLTSLLILALNPTIVLLEEPENHMHPAGMKTFMNFILKLAKERKFQTIISTHSIELVSIMSKLSQDLGLETTILFLERDSEGYVDVRKLKGLDVEVLRKLGLDPRFLYIV